MYSFSLGSIYTNPGERWDIAQSDIATKKKWMWDRNKTQPNLEDHNSDCTWL